MTGATGLTGLTGTGQLVRLILRLDRVRLPLWILAIAGIGGILAGAGVWWLAARVQDVVPDAVDRAVFLGPIVQEFEARFTAAMTPQAARSLMRPAPRPGRSARSGRSPRCTDRRSGPRPRDR